MTEPKASPVAILGAGLAGLAAARTLERAGVPVVVFEASPRIAGLAESFTDAEGFSHDFGAHFATNRLIATIGAGAGSRTVRRYGETVWIGSRTYGYPFGLMRSPRYAVSGAWTRVARLARPVAGDSAADWFRAQYGRALADEVALPLVEAWSGAPADELAASVGDKIPSSILGTIGLKLAARFTNRAVAIGYCRELPQSPHVWHAYPAGGVATLCKALAQGLTGEVRTRSPVERIVVEEGRVRAVRVGGALIPVRAVVSTAPVHVLAKLVEGTHALEPLARFRYRPMAFVNLRMAGRGLLPDVVTWTPERRFPFFRLTEAPLSMPWLAPEGKTILTVDIGCEVGDETWSKPDDALVGLSLDALSPIVKDAKQRVLGADVLKTPIAYPIFLREYEADRLRFQRDTGVAGLVSVGRNGEFDHLLMEDVYWRTVRRMRRLAHDLADSSAAPKEIRDDRSRD